MPFVIWKAIDCLRNSQFNVDQNRIQCLILSRKPNISFTSPSCLHRYPNSQQYNIVVNALLQAYPFLDEDGNGFVSIVVFFHIMNHEKIIQFRGNQYQFLICWLYSEHTHLAVFGKSHSYFIMSIKD